MEYSVDAFTKLFSEKSFIDELTGTKSIEGVQQLFAEHGITLSLEETKTILKSIKGQLDNPSEISEDVLEDVTGGSLTVLGFAGVAIASFLVASGVGYVVSKFLNSIGC